MMAYANWITGRRYQAGGETHKTFAAGVGAHGISTVGR